MAEEHDPNNNKATAGQNEEIVGQLNDLVSKKNASALDTSLSEKHDSYITTGKWKDKQIAGEWKVEIAYFINNGVKDEGSPPLVNTIWSFDKTGSLKVTTSMEINGSFTQKNDTLIVNLLGQQTIYTIMNLSENSLTLQLTIIETESTSMKVLTEFSKL